MNRKQTFTIVFIGIITIALMAPASWAGSRNFHRLEGFAIGVGTVLLTHALIDHQQNHRDRATVTTTVRYERPHRRQHRPSGYWEIQKEWVPAKYKKVWNPGHYNRAGKWIRGRWIKIKDRPGYWTKKRVWVPYSYYD